MPRDERFIATLKAPFGQLDTTLAEARALVALCGKLGLVVTAIQGNQTVSGPPGAQEVSVADMQAAGVTDSDQIYLELVIAGQTGGIDVAQTLANIRANFQNGVYLLMLDVYQNAGVARERSANAILSIPDVRAAAAAALKV